MSFKQCTVGLIRNGLKYLGVENIALVAVTVSAILCCRNTNCEPQNTLLSALHESLDDTALKLKRAPKARENSAQQYQSGQGGRKLASSRSRRGAANAR